MKRPIPPYPGDIPHIPHIQRGPRKPPELKRTAPGDEIVGERQREMIKNIPRMKKPDSTLKPWT